MANLHAPLKNLGKKLDQVSDSIYNGHIETSGMAETKSRNRSAFRLLSTPVMSSNLIKSSFEPQLGDIHILQDGFFPPTSHDLNKPQEPFYFLYTVVAIASNKPFNFHSVLFDGKLQGSSPAWSIGSATMWPVGYARWVSECLVLGLGPHRTLILA